MFRLDVAVLSLNLRLVCEALSTTERRLRKVRVWKRRAKMYGLEAQERRLNERQSHQHRRGRECA